MLRRHFVLKLLAAGVLASPTLAQKAPQYVFTSFDPPGSTYTRGDGVNNPGTIVGYFNDAIGASTYLNISTSTVVTSLEI
jgi:hypothetical protein